MHNEANNLMAGGGSLLVLVAWAGVSLYATGPSIASRTIDKSGWHSQCKHQIVVQSKQEHQATAAPVAQMDCNAILGGIYGKLGTAICRSGGGRLVDQALSQKRKAFEAVERKRQALIDDAAANAGTRCNCAISSTIQKNRIPFGVYAGTLRLVQPVSVTNLNAELGTALRSPICNQQRSR